MFQSIESFLLQKPVVFQILRFAGIGALNTALDFLILNLLTTAWGVESGPLLAGVNVVGTVAAMIQSYAWNKYWAFATQTSVSVVRQFFGAVLVGGLGFAAFCAAVLPSLAPVLAQRGIVLGSFSIQYYWILLLSFLFVQLVLAANLGLFHAGAHAESRNAFEMGKFVLVSVIGVAINSVILYVLATALVWLVPAFPIALAKNVAKFAAIFISLVWNFIGYKFFVFKR